MSNEKKYFTCEENFFIQPQIIREEAIFLGINKLCALFPCDRRVAASLRELKSINRSVVRKFCEGNITAVDLAGVRLRRDGGKVILQPILNEFSESGFSLLIKEPGLYNFNRISIEVAENKEENKKETGFFACLPLILRSAFKEDFLICNGKKITGKDLGKNVIYAGDAFGTAAFIDLTKKSITQRRSDAAFLDENFTSPSFIFFVS